ncbi:MAG TPA: imelysin family protein [Chitinophagales bacterium]|jgi:predicted lipoprotein|nr:imelysin family protein [Chitinophagales bacterium]MBP6154041.1 imelysin family protein [Chitinophagales bacterium]HQV78339.1 imelysin family protein [Chitinophagales bacterium]HQW79490.1 imelysin family protein [Chitinophagales bacterium]HRB18741.1 imelysin family protein [Chitinophagales bacterium]
MKNTNYTILAFYLVIISIVSCTTPKSTDSFDKKAMFINYADNLILPAYTHYGKTLDSLQIAVDNFNSTTDISTLNKLQSALLVAYSSWQFCEIYEKTAPADEVQANMNTNYYPCRMDSINAYIIRNENTPNVVKNKPKNDKGFAAIEYLLFSRTLTQQQILDRFTIDAHASSRKEYLTALISNLKDIQTEVISKWSSYRAIFINSLGTDAAGSFSLMVNSLAQRNDDFKRHQVGIPAGYSGNVATINVNPQAVQAYYSNKNIEYMLLTLNNMKDVLNGKNVTDGIGLIDYIRTLEVTSTFGGNLADDVINQIDVCIAKVNACGSDFSEIVQNDKPKADALFLEAKKLLVLMKVDVPSALGVSITYTDSDGD